MSAEGAKAVGGLHHFVTTGTALPARLIHLVLLRVSQINGCAHCIDIHTRDLLKEGMNAINRLGISFRLKPCAKADA